MKWALKLEWHPPLHSFSRFSQLANQLCRAMLTNIRKEIPG